MLTCPVAMEYIFTLFILHCCLSVSEYLHVLYTYMYAYLNIMCNIWYVRHKLIVYLWLWPQYYDSMWNSCSLHRNCSKKEKKDTTNPLKITNLPRNDRNSGSHLHMKYSYTIRIPLSVPMTKQVARHFSLPVKPTQLDSKKQHLAMNARKRGGTSCFLNPAPCFFNPRWGEVVKI